MGVTVAGVTATITWNSDSQITIVTPTVTAGDEVIITRVTPRSANTDRVVDFEDGSGLPAADLDNSALQNYYLAQETIDDIEDFTDAGASATAAAGSETNAAVSAAAALVSENAAAASAATLDLTEPGPIGGTTPAAGDFTTLEGTVVTATTSLDINSSIAVTGTLDEDAMGSDSAVKLATQQSIKAYVDAMPGVKQVVTVATSTHATDAVTTPAADDSIPQNSEGFEVFTLAITPLSATNRLIFYYEGSHTNTTANVDIVASLFQDSTGDALTTSSLESTNGGETNQLQLHHEMAAGTTSSTTFKIRVGAGSGNVTTNGIATRLYGGALTTRLTIIEFKPS